MVIVPYTLPELIAKQTYKSFITCTALIFIALFIAIIIMLRTIAIGPIKKMTGAAEQLVFGDIKAAEGEVFSSHEIATLGHSINKLRRILANEPVSSRETPLLAHARE